MNVKVIYEDNHLLVVEKPVNLLTQADITGDADLLSLLKADLKKRNNKPGNAFLGLVHRLDRPVGGVMVFAKTSKAASRLSDQIRKRELEKSYLAVIHGKLDKQEDKLEHYLSKDPNTNTVYNVLESVPGAKKAELYYKLLDYRKGLCLVKIVLITGRSHQIRVQFASEGNHVFGDRKYGDTSKMLTNEKNLALWSEKISFKHPVRDKKMTFHCKPPDNQPWDMFSAAENIFEN